MVLSSRAKEVFASFGGCNFFCRTHVAFPTLLTAAGMLLEHAMAAVCIACHSKHTGCNDSGSTRAILAFIAHRSRFTCTGWRSVIAPSSMAASLDQGKGPVAPTEVGSLTCPPDYYLGRRFRMSIHGSQILNLHPVIHGICPAAVTQCGTLRPAVVFSRHQASTILAA